MLLDLTGGNAYAIPALLQSSKSFIYFFPHAYYEKRREARTKSLRQNYPDVRLSISGKHKPTLH